jgi:hypothetical protein
MTVMSLKTFFFSHFTDTFLYEYNVTNDRSGQIRNETFFMSAMSPVNGQVIPAIKLISYKVVAFWTLDSSENNFLFLIITRYCYVSVRVFLLCLQVSYHSVQK